MRRPPKTIAAAATPSHPIAARAATALLIAVLPALLVVSAARGQEEIESRVPATWSRYYDYEEMTRLVQEIARAYPELVELRSLGESQEGRDIWLAIVNAPDTGPHTSKPAMYIDGNVHGNEIQATEMVLYALWYLTKAYGKNDDLTELVDRCAFYLVPSQNPDGRAHWFGDPATSSSFRWSSRPRDNDRDGLVDEDPPDDLDGDGSITRMYKEDPHGSWIRSRTDPRRFERVGPGEKGDWTFLGFEGIDNDGDGRINEDGIGGDDMNRDWPGGWQPAHIQGAAGPYPLWSPETRAIADFIHDHRNIAGVQSYHNAGGMILRGPGSEHRESLYARDDRAVYDEIGRLGEKMLPYYRYLVIYKDLYSVHGGFVNWTAETLGIVSFTNELWTFGKYFQGDPAKRPDRDDLWMFRDRLQFGQVFTPYTEVEHPAHGTILVGGLNKWSSRNTPTFMLEEECHRNFAFTMFHADQMPDLSFERVQTSELRPGVWSVKAEVANDRVLPTRMGVARRRGIGTPDRMRCAASGTGRVVAGGTMRSWRDAPMEAARHEPARLLVEGGIPGRGSRVFRFVVTGREGDSVTLRYEAEKAKDVETTVTLE